MALTVAGALACHDTPTSLVGERPLVPFGPAARVTVPSDADLQAQESFASLTKTITVNANGSLSGSGYLGQDWYTRTIYQASITGSVTATSTPDFPPPQTQTWGTCNNAGHIPQLVYGTPSIYGTGSWSACESGPYKDFTVTGSSQSYGMFLLNTYSQTNCSRYTGVFLPCFTFSGSYTLTMTRLEADLVLTPSATTFLAGAAVTFQWAATPDSLAGQATPVVVRRTFFEPDSAGGGVPSDSTKTCAISGTSCTIQPLGSGTLHLWALVNGKLVHKQAHVTVVPCPTGDTLLDNPTFRKLIKIVWDSSNASDSTKRMERLGVLLYDTVSHSYSNMLLPLNSDSSKNSQCSVKPGSWSIPTKSIVVTYVHSHPFKPGTQFSGHCPKGDDGKYLMYNWNLLTGWASGQDWHVSQSLHLPSYIVDSLHIIRIVGDSGNVEVVRNNDGSPKLDSGGDTTYTATDWPHAQKTYLRTPACTYMLAQAESPQSRATAVDFLAIPRNQSGAIAQRVPIFMRRRRQAISTRAFVPLLESMNYSTEEGEHMSSLASHPLVATLRARSPKAVIWRTSTNA